MKGRIIEIFSSIQGEGLWMGRPQIFVRFHGCRLACSYCDTPLTHKDIHEARIEYPPYSKKFERRSLEFGVEELNSVLRRFLVSSLAITGGEPLEQAEFLTSWLPTVAADCSILLETSGVEVEAMEKILPWVSIVSLDLKIPSATGEGPFWRTHDRFLEVVSPKSHYAKIVYDERMTEQEQEELLAIARRHPTLALVFQPVSPIQKRDMRRCLSIFEKFSAAFPDRVRFIPQMHKFLSIL